MIYHIVVGDEAGKPLKAAVATEATIAGEVIVLKDILHVGPIQRADNQSFSSLRSEWWQMVAPDSKSPIEVNDLERLLEVSNELHKNGDAQVWFWMAPGPADVCAYYWMLEYIGKHAGRIFIANLANLPFLDEAGKVFYPKSISELLPRELIKARKLARLVTPSEFEMDGDYWRNLVSENAGIRILEGGKKLLSRAENFYDAQLISVLSNNYQKAARVIGQALTKYNLPTGDVHLAWRLREMANAALIELKGDPAKPYREWEVRLPATEEAGTTPVDALTSQDAI